MSEVEKGAPEKGTTGINGVVDEDVQLMTEEELEKAKMRPADIDQDMKEMERRKRVENIMNSALFREELERIIETQIQEGYTGYQTLQNISEMIGIPTSRTSIFRGTQSVIPVNDIRGMESLNYAKGEKLLRCKLAALYRLIDMHGWTQSIYNHCTARISQDTEHFLLNPFGMLYHEVTAASLVKVDMQGNIVDPGSTNFGVNVAGFLLHSAIHAARPDIRCIIHLHHPAVIAVSALKDGFLPLSQESLLIGDVSYHDYCGIFVSPEEKEKLGRNLGPVNKILFLRNHGVVCCGDSIEEAWYNTYHTVLACETQMKMAPLGFNNVVLVSDEARQAAYETARRGGGGVDSKQEGGPSQQGQKERKWKVGEIEFEALMRSMDNAGLRTGYIYRRPLVKSEPLRLLSDVALPPTASNYAYLFDDDELNRSPLKRLLDGRKAQDKTRWLNSPNVYSKVEVLETGTPDPKKITKWVADGSPTHSTAVKLEDPLMFVPKDTDPKEFKKIQKMIKENRRIGNISAGPTSHVLEGVSWEEARRMQDASMSSTGDHVIMVGAASKGIIQREFQHNAVVYKTPYAKNPFDAISDQELEEYRRTIERKQKGEPEEIQVEQMNITPEVATRDVVDESRQVISPMSPLSDEDVPSARQLQVETKIAPRASKAQAVVVSDDGKVIRQKPVVPPKPNIPKPMQSQGAPGGQHTPPPKKVQASMKTLPERDGLPPGVTSGVRYPSSRTTPSRATLPRTPGNKLENSTPRTNSLSRGLAKMLKMSRSKKEHDAPPGGHSKSDVVNPHDVVTHDEMAHPHLVDRHMVEHDNISELKEGQFSMIQGTVQPQTIVPLPVAVQGTVDETKLELDTVPQPGVQNSKATATPRKEYVVRRIVEDSSSSRFNASKPGEVPSYSKPFRVTSVPETKGDALANGEETEAHHSTLSHSSKEGSPTKDTSLTDDSVSKEKKKKKKGLRTPSFLKKKKDKKKEKEAAVMSS